MSGTNYKPQRNSDDQDDRIEWQLDQIRMAVTFLAWVTALGIVAGFFLAVSA